MILRLIAAFMLATASAAFAEDAPRFAQLSQLPQDELLRRWATARCFAKAFDKSDTSEDANASAGAYLEAGKVEAEAYEKLDQMVAAVLSVPATGSVKSRYDVLKCIEFSRGGELLAASQKFSKEFATKP